MKSIRILSPSLDLLGEIDNYESLIFNLKYYTYGTFELTININKQSTDTLQKNNLVMLANKKVGIIKYRDIVQDTETLTVKGYTLGGIFLQRTTVPPVGEAYDKLTANYETIMKTYVDHNCINATDTNRNFAMLENATDQNRGASTTYQTRYSILADELETLAKASDLGWHVYLDLNNLKWVFDVYEGKDLTVNQSTNPPVIFANEFDNISNQEYTESIIGTYNIGYVGGEGEGENRTVVEVGNSTGLERSEVFVDARDLSDTTELEERGEQKLAELEETQSLECEILNSTFIYEQDWGLGDIVTVQNTKWGLTMDTRITEIDEAYDSTGTTINVTFGNSLPTLTSKIKREINTINL